jgi:hypothetical protein
LPITINTVSIYSYANPKITIQRDIITGYYYLQGQFGNIPAGYISPYRIEVCLTDSPDTQDCSGLNESLNMYDLKYIGTLTFNAPPLILLSRDTNIVITLGIRNDFVVDWYDFDQFSNNPSGYSMSSFLNNNPASGVNTNQIIKFYYQKINPADTSDTLLSFSNNRGTYDAVSQTATGSINGYLVINDELLYDPTGNAYVNYRLIESLPMSFTFVNPANLFSSKNPQDFLNPMCKQGIAYDYQIQIEATGRTFLTIDIFIANSNQTGTIIIHADLTPGLLRIQNPVVGIYTIRFLAIDKLTEQKQQFTYTLSCYPNVALNIQMNNLDSSGKPLTQGIYPDYTSGNVTNSYYVIESNISYQFTVNTL